MEYHPENCSRMWRTRVIPGSNRDRTQGLWIWCLLCFRTFHPSLDGSLFYPSFKYELSCRYFSSLSLVNPFSPTSPREPETKSLSWLALVISGGVAGVVGWMATFPL